MENLIPVETKHILFRYSFKEIIASSKNQGIQFIPGRQTVDVIFLIRNTTDGKVYVLLGKRSMQKKDFPGYLALPGGGIDKYETPIAAALREFYEETGLKLQMLDNSLEPAIVKFENVPNSNLEQMFFIGIYSSEDTKLSGTRGGSSQCFGVFIEDEMYKYQEYLESKSDLTEVEFYEISEAISKGLAYQHGEMIQKAIIMFDAYPKLIMPLPQKVENKKQSLVISFLGAPGVGKSTAALGTTFELKKRGLSTELVQEFAKDLLYSGLLGKYIPNQSYIVSEQYKRIYDLIGQVDYIVTDAGMEISALHSLNEDKIVEDLAWYLRNKTNQVTILIERDVENVKFESKGRKENEAESRIFGKRLEEYLETKKVNYYKAKGTDEAIAIALGEVKKYQKSNETKG